MSLFRWLFPAETPARAAYESSGLSQMEPTRPADTGKRGPAEERRGSSQLANRKGERMARRELLYTVVRDSMVRSGVQSKSYKFKVLSLDARGRQFLVMVDLARESGCETSQLAGIEALIVQAAKASQDIVVTAVYWRMNQHAEIGVPAGRTQLKHAAESADSKPVPLASQPGALTAASVHPALSRFEPIEPDEVAAFKQALAAGGAAPSRGASAGGAAVQTGATARAFDGSLKHGPQSYTLLTGYEDTEVSDADPRAPVLSGTQYGDLN